MAKIYCGMTLDPEVVETLKSWAEAEDRSLSYYVNQILQEEIRRRETKKQKVQELPTERPKGRRRIVRPKEVAK